MWELVLLRGRRTTPHPGVVSFLYSLLSVTIVTSQEPSFDRLPYLQSLEGRSVAIAWRSDVEATSRVEFGAVGAERRTVRVTTPTTRHAVILEDLSPDTRVEYRVILESGGGTDGAISDTFTFRTAPEDATHEIRFAVFGDSGAGSQAQRDVLELVVALEPDFIITTGDNAYPGGRDVDFQRNFFEVYEDLLTEVAIFPSAGNHDLSSGPENFVENFHLPANNPLGDETFYSFDFGPAHFACLNSAYGSEDVPLRDPNSAQVDWLKADLAQTNQTWKILFLHDPVFDTEPSEFDSGLRAVLEPIVRDFDVDLVLSGDDHLYYRTHPVLETEVVDAWQEKLETSGEDVYLSPRGPVYVVSGGGGQILESFLTDRSRFVKVLEPVFHTLDIRLNPERLTVRAVAVNGTPNGVEVDRFIIDKSLPRPVFEFQRGDVSVNGAVDIADPVRVLEFMFLGRTPDCASGLDWNADGALEIDDPLSILSYLFLGTTPGAAPFPECGTAPSADDAFCFRTACF